jgi:hypothetical protein
MQENFRIEDRPEVDEAVLRPVTGQLETSQALEFQIACLHLLETGRRRLVVDLRGFRAIPSIIFGAVLDTYTLARGRELVLAADAGTTDVFRKLVPRLLAVMETPDGVRAEDGGEEAKPG